MVSSKETKDYKLSRPTMGNKFYVEMHLRHRRITSVLKQFAFKVISGLQFYQELAKIISKKLLLYLIHNFNTFERNHHNN